MTQRSDTFAPMTIENAPGLRAQTAPELLALIPQLIDDVKSAPQTDQHCLDFLRRLLMGPTPEEAATYMAHALAPRHAIWWGHECLQAMPDFLTDQDRQMLGLVAAWVGEPDEDHRNAVLDQAQAAELRGPGVWLGLATGWSGGSMSRPGLPVVAPPPYVLGRALNAAILTALARVPQDRRARMLSHYVTMGEVLAKSG